MYRLDNTIQRYAWGSRTALGELRGAPVPTEDPEAELWMGAHPVASSRVEGGRTLIDRIDEDPATELGSASLAAFGPRLPFLLKVLAAEQPLSLQAHPSIAQAEEGFEREEQAGVPRTAPNRNYRDRNHKPELISAVSPFDALCGFRAVDDTRRLFERLDQPDLAARVADLRSMFAWLMTLDPGEREALVCRVVAACHGVRDGAFADECAWATRIAGLYPGDAGVIGALLLNLVHLEPGEAIYLPAGNLHAYLHGVGIEVMASSDNVLRGGLTPKHVDVPELLRILDFTSGPVAKLMPTRVGALETWRTPAREFALFRARGATTTIRVPGPLIALCTEGTVSLTDDRGTEQLGRGESAFVAGSTSQLAVRGEGVAYLATCGDAVT